MTITTSPGCNWSPTAQSQAGTSSCMITATITYSGCTITMTNESFQTYCDGNNQCSFTEIDGIAQNLKCDGSSWTTTTSTNGQTLTETGSCTCQVLNVAAVPSASTTGPNIPPTPSSGSSTMLRTSTVLLMLCVVAFNIAGNL
ncbi:hypothetical protein K450DRAFT_199483 [Umbelopsis ramanniana AG]|uniref:Uncharacterized protein n=1 Tax=Umbelopsis ramanniana AG TaxID=1314678 RepID=A0AAD5EAP1_UMBRA|nr:uncharacterized protein K450DRAFT_199483 [Umbelopsis ramanniana AG]KAI8579476.1 hypothetical protein K450DRAFT_199483 [Umbelopsis ramanniana AG]